MSASETGASASMIDRVVRIMRSFEVGDSDLSLAEISSRSGVPKSSVHRLIHILVGHGLMKAAGNGSYSLGIGLWELGVRAIGGQSTLADLSAIAKRTAEHFGETSHVGVLDDWDVVYVVRAESQRAVAVRTHIGQRVPAHATATGKSLLAAMIDDVSECGDHQLARFTNRTITDLDQLMRELDVVRERGYATNLGGWQSELCGAAAVIYGHDGEPVGSLGIAGPTYRFSQQSLDEVGVEIHQLAIEASISLGYMGAVGPGARRT